MRLTVQCLRLQILGRYLAMMLGFGLLAGLCILWAPWASALLLLRRPKEPWNRRGRRVIRMGFRAYLETLKFLKFIEIDLLEFSCQDLTKPMLLAPNHPSLLDALLLLAYGPDLICVMKSDLFAHPLLGPGARLAGYISNRRPRRMIVDAIQALENGHSILLFPEGTRTPGNLLGELKQSPAVIAQRSGCDIQTVLIEINSGFLGKNWHWRQPPVLPLRVRLRLGPRLKPNPDIRQMTRDLRACYFEAKESAAEPFGCVA